MVITNDSATAHDSREQRLAREERGIQLYQDHGAGIQQLRVGLYSVPSCTTKGEYLVEYGAGVESCECKDFEFHGEDFPCKHLIACAIFAAKRRKAIRVAFAPVLEEL